MTTCGEAQLILILWEDKAGDSAVVEGGLPVHCDAAARLSLLHLPIVLCFKLHQRPKDVLICVCILVPAITPSMIPNSELTRMLD